MVLAEGSPSVGDSSERVPGGPESGKDRVLMIRQILAPLDGSPLAEGVLPHLVALCRALDSHATLLRVVASARKNRARLAVSALRSRMMRAEAGAYLREVARRLQDVGLTATVSLLEGDPASRILEYVRHEDVDLILLSSHGQSGLAEWGMSSVVQKVIMHAFAPVLLVRAFGTSSQGRLDTLRYRRIMVPVDGSQRAECALPLAEALANVHGASLLLSHVVAEPEVPRRMPLRAEERRLADRLTASNREDAERYLEGLRSRLSADVRVHLRVGANPAVALHDLMRAEEIDLVVLSAHGYSGGMRWPYGSVALNLLFYGTAPLMMVQDLPRADAEPTEAEIAARESKGY